MVYVHLQDMLYFVLFWSLCKGGRLLEEKNFVVTKKQVSFYALIYSLLLYSGIVKESWALNYNLWMLLNEDLFLLAIVSPFRCWWLNEIVIKSCKQEEILGTHMKLWIPPNGKNFSISTKVVVEYY